MRGDYGSANLRYEKEVCYNEEYDRDEIFRRYGEEKQMEKAVAAK